MSLRRAFKPLKTLTNYLDSKAPTRTAAFAAAAPAKPALRLVRSDRLNGCDQHHAVVRGGSASTARQRRIAVRACEDFRYEGSVKLRDGAAAQVWRHEWRPRVMILRCAAPTAPVRLRYVKNVGQYGWGKNRKPVMFAQLRRDPEGSDAATVPSSQIGRAMKVTGTLETEGELYVHGTVTGRINALRLILGSHGSVEGDVVAREVHIEGRLNGRIFALNVTVESSANVTGRIFHNTVTVAKGAHIDGRMPWRPPSYFETLTQLPETRP
jgi:cytoskeletal protein CcmA (bactofilin family)